jgi:hypothetical protein
MNDTALLNPDPEPQPDAALNELQVQYLILRKLFLVTVVVLLIFSGSINLFLLRQVISARKDIESVRPRATQMVAAYQQTEEPLIKGFLNSLVSFSQTHPDFKPILAKYNIVPATAATSAPGAVAPTPVK